MVQILISFNLRPGVEREYSAFVVEKGVPFWHTQQGIVAVRGYRNILGGTPQIFSEVDCDSLEDAMAVLSSQAYRAIVEQQAQFVTDRTVVLLAPTGRTKD